MAGTRRHEKPLRRTNPSGRQVWVARYTGRDGRRRSAGTFDLKRDAQDAIDAAYDRDHPRDRRETVGTYFSGWLERHPRSDRTNRSHGQRVQALLDVEVDGLPFKDWPIREVGRRQVTDLLDVLLRKQKRAAGGAQGVLRAYSAMFSDALNDDYVDHNPFLRVRVRASDVRVVKPPRQIRTYTIADMHELARRTRTMMGHGSPEGKAWRYVYGETMIRILSDCGLRLGELLALRRTDVKLERCDETGCVVDCSHLHVRFTAHEGRVQAGTKTDHGRANAGRVVPIPAELEAMLRVLPRRIDTPFLLPSPRAKVWRERNWYRDVWYPARDMSPIPFATPHEFRHSWISLLRAEGIDPADLAAAAGHTVQTATAHYTHALYRSFDKMRGALG